MDGQIKSTTLPQQMLTVSQVTALTGFGRSKIYALISAGVLQSVRIGGSRRISDEAVAALKRTDAPGATLKAAADKRRDASLPPQV